MYVNKDIYLFEFDISYSGQKTLYPKNKLYEYFKAYLLMADHIYLQASAPMKIKEVYVLFQKFEECFKMNNIDKIPIVSFVLSKDIYSYSEYLDQRLRKLSKAHINPKKNPEYNAYNVNNAQEIVKSLDQKIIYNNNGLYFKRRDFSADMLFRRNVSYLFKNDKFLKKFNINDRLQKELLKYPNEMELFQTFELGKILKTDLKLHYHYKITELIRKMYYKANQEAVRANSSLVDKHFKLEYIYQFYKLLSIEKYIAKINSCEQIINLRANEYFKYLKTIFFEAISETSLKKLKDSFEWGKYFNIIHYSYDWLIPLAMFILLNGIEAYISIATFALFKDITKDILQNIINRWLNNIPEYNEYKIYQAKKSLLETIKNA